MIVREYPYIDESGKEHTELERHYSDKGMMILQVETGIEYGEAVDVIPCKYTYEETETPVEQDELADAIHALNILGVE